MASLDGGILVIFNYLSASEIWPDKRMAFDGSELYYRYLKLQILFVPLHQIFLKTLQRERNSFVNKVLYNVCTLYSEL